MRPGPSERNRLISALALAKRLLVAALLAELVLFTPGTLVAPERSFQFAWVAGAALGALGFLIAYRKLRLAEEMADSPVLPFFGPNIRAMGALFLLAAIAIPLLNLVIFAWTWFKAHAGIKALRAEGAFQATLDARRARLRGG